MRKIDFKHTAFHVLVSIYFLWFIVYGVLIGMSLFNVFYEKNAAMNDIFFAWILLNLFMGFVLFIVIRMFKNETLLGKIILYSFASIIFMAWITIGILKSWI